MRTLLSCVEHDPARFGPLVRARWDELEVDLAPRVAAVEAEAESLRRAGRGDDARAVLGGCSARAVAAYVERTDTLIAELQSLGAPAQS